MTVLELLDVMIKEEDQGCVSLDHSSPNDYYGYIMTKYDVRLSHVSQALDRAGISGFSIDDMNYVPERDLYTVSLTRGRHKESPAWGRGHLVYFKDIPAAQDYIDSHYSGGTSDIVDFNYSSFECALYEVEPDMFISLGKRRM